MIGITEIAHHIPKSTSDNYTKLEKFSIDSDFLESKIGFRYLARKNAADETSDLCVKAYLELVSKISYRLESEVDCVCLCTQNGDTPIPHTSAVIHRKLGLAKTCAAYDISLGCSGYVYALHNIHNFMAANEMRCGLLFTCDPYSKIVNPDDRNTDLLFADAATVTLISPERRAVLHKGVFMTDSKGTDALIQQRGDFLYMNGRSIFDLSMSNVPGLVHECLARNEIDKDEIDDYFFHQASRYMIENLAARIGLPTDKVPFTAYGCGNTVSSTIPILISQQNFLDSDQTDPGRKAMLCGFGVGFSLAATLIEKHE